jgi:hypothetical protein
LFNAQVRLASSTNFSDPDASKPTLDIDPFKKSARLNRPMSPHLTIYEPQLTWLLSGFHRITGFAVGGCNNSIKSSVLSWSNGVCCFST